MTTVMGMHVNKPKHRKPHVVAAGPTFTKGQSPDQAPLTCSCEWSGTVADWSEHSKRTSVSRAWTEAGPPPPKRERSPMRAACPQGHTYSVKNTYISRIGTYTCRTCRRLNARVAYALYKIPGTRVIAA